MGCNTLFQPVSLANIVLGASPGAVLGGITEGQAVKAERPTNQDSYSR